MQSQFIHSQLIHWFQENNRDLPWRKTSPWGVLVSEFMLQQTPVNRVLPIWTEWMKTWPEPQALARANKSEVIRAWGGLGYPRRAIRLHESARVIAQQFGNQVPSTYEELLLLPGVGDYTAAAILAFAFNQKSLVLDINIRRLFFRLIDGVESPPSHISMIERALRVDLIPKEQPHIWAAATMEFGALICTAKNPNCGACPLQDQCAWRALDYPKSKPRPKPKFTGSDRQCRGTILKTLRIQDDATHSELSALWPDGVQYEKALKTLIADGLIETTGKKSYKLAN